MAAALASTTFAGIATNASPEQLLGRASLVIRSVAAALASAGLLSGSDDARASALWGSSDGVAADGGGVSESKATDAPADDVDSWAKDISAVVLSAVGDASWREEGVYRAVMFELTGTTGQLPSPVQILWGDPSVSPVEVRSFVRRAAAFPELPFAVMDTNALTAPCREELLHGIARGSGRRAQLLLVFTASPGLSSFSLTCKRRELKSSNLQPASRFRQLGGALNAASPTACFHSVSLIAGRAGSGKTTWAWQKLAAVPRGKERCVVVSAHSGFDVGAFGARYGAVASDALRVAPERGEPRTGAVTSAAAPPALTTPATPARPIVGIFFSISPAAVLPEATAKSGHATSHAPLAAALHSFFTHGIVMNPTTGECVALNPALRHQVVVELPALHAWPHPGENPATLSVTQHPFVATELLARSRISPGLPVLNAARTESVMVSDSFDFVVDSDVRRAALALQALLPTIVSLGGVGRALTSSIANLLNSGVALTDAQAREAMQQFWSQPACINVPSTKRARATFLRLLASRLAYLDGPLRRHVLAMGQIGAESNVSRVASRMGDAFWARLQHVFIAESIKLSDTRMRADWARGDRQPVWSIRDVHAVTFRLLCLDPAIAHETLRAHALGSSFSSGLSLESSTVSLLRGMPELVDIPNTAIRGAASAPESPSASDATAAPLRVHLAPAFGLSNTSLAQSILSSQGYVLSDDFAVKLLVLHERRRVGSNVIL